MGSVPCAVRERDGRETFHFISFFGRCLVLCPVLTAMCARGAVVSARAFPVSPFEPELTYDFSMDLFR